MEITKQAKQIFARWPKGRTRDWLRAIEGTERLLLWCKNCNKRCTKKCGTGQFLDIYARAMVLISGFTTECTGQHLHGKDDNKTLVKRIHKGDT